ncbi:ABC transporter ATP-binding protein [Bathymodiolus thermophilus thioautotrophic gill symbiont]|uniref:AAA family ATPase n=1 Tax=Bathymodiolus thermophilus thioautotrophic gill symbiont TaxID=2360 RepID=UPI0010B2551F|nr:AAA family ATPase [Bathymodiolus thermophilus thioautotrophic gill symbiont]SHA07430.1 ABC transporter ATP-binding protein [Bathymodiolus thermophilus thioautotrophic gill symbiont]
MNLNIKVENLGRFKKGEVKLRPLTVLTGENGTGKSFFTKTLYSIFSVLNKNLLHIEIDKTIVAINIDLESFIAQVQRKSALEENMVKDVKTKLNLFKDALNVFKDENIRFYKIKIQELHKDIEKPINKLNKHFEKIQNNPIKVKFIKNKIKELQNNFSILESFTKHNIYPKILSKNLSSEIKENFQISNLYELISFDGSKCQIYDKKNGLNISFNKDNFVDFSLEHDFIAEVSNLDRVIFFESPAYWSVRDALNNSKEVEKKGDLTGVSKYFYDLDKTLNTKSTNQPLEIVSKLAVELKEEIGGEFIFDSGRLSFVDNSGKNIDKNLISFGMTNLGMIQALLKNNVISKGSFVFFDEPETNLHPTWQVLLTKVLIELAENGVNVVMATHSLDMIKALEVHTKDKDEKFIAVNHFTKEGRLFEFDSDDITENLIASRNELMGAYEGLFLSEFYGSETTQ